ncbi:MAG: cyclic dehypoxanthinyl futalosine synthase [Phycisphaerae bacterium]
MPRITCGQAANMLLHEDMHELGKLADVEVCRLFPVPIRTYIVDRNINYSNVCSCGCKFCNFWRKENSDEGFVLEKDQILTKIQELVDLGGIQILLQGGHHPSLSLEWYLDMLRTIKSHFPKIHIHGFSPPEIFYFHLHFGKSIETILKEFQQAGLDTVPGGGAEILVDRVRQLTSPGKCTSDQWLEVMRTAHELGMRTTATMMFGHLETAAERVEHLDHLRKLQDETGGFTAFICWPFQPYGTRLANEYEICHRRNCPAGNHLHLAGVQDYLRTLAVSRLFLDNFENIQASWVTQSPPIGEIALKFGANDFGSLMLEENVVASTGVRFKILEEELQEYVRRAGYQPVRRNCYYQLEK